MAAPVAGYVRLADDSGYTGKTRFLHAQSRVVGSDTVYEEFVVFDRRAKVVGVYEGALTQQSVSATLQDGLATGFMWLHMPAAISGRSARIRRIYYTPQMAATTTTAASAPRLRIDRFTFTGTATGATVRADADASYNLPKLDMRTAVTGLTVSLVAAVFAGAICGAVDSTTATKAVALGPASISLTDFPGGTHDEDEWIVLAPGEGIVLYQDVVGLASDPRRFDLTVVWDEIDTA